MKNEISKAEIDSLYEHGLIKYRDYLNIITPQDFLWSAWAKNNLRFFGVIFMLAGIVCFFAYNWAQLGKLFKLGLPFSLFVVLGILTVLKGTDGLFGKLTSVSAAFMTGVFLAVFGQVYQTGADAWQLFALWAALILPLVILTRFTALWTLFAVVVNIFLLSYPLAEVFGGNSVFIIPAAFNLFLFCTAEFYSSKAGCLKESYFKTLTFAAALIFLAWPGVFDAGKLKYWPSFAAYLSFAVIWAVYFVRAKKYLLQIGLIAGSAALSLSFLAINKIDLKADSANMLLLSVCSLAFFGLAAYAVIAAHKHIRGGKL